MAIDADSRKLSGFVLVLVAAYLVGEPVNNLFRCQLSTLNFYLLSVLLTGPCLHRLVIGPVQKTPIFQIGTTSCASIP